MVFETDFSLAGTQHRPKKLSVFQRAKRGCERFCSDFCQCWRGMSTWLAKKFPSRSKRIDVVARILFPLVFAIFNLSYWTFYLLQHESSKFNWFFSLVFLFNLNSPFYIHYTLSLTAIVPKSLFIPLSLWQLCQKSRPFYIS